MPHEIGFVVNDGTLAHYKMLDKIKTFAEANGYTVLFYDTAIANRELILKAPGYSGTEEIFMGFRCYQNAGTDYYNMTVAAFTGYVVGTAFASQPGAILSGIPAHNNRIDYWLTLTPQRIVIAMKVGTPVYEVCYAGKFFPYSTPTQYPYPVVCAGMLNGESATRFSDTAHSMPFKGNRVNMRMRFNDGVWKQPLCWPFSSTYYANSNSSAASQLRDLNGQYSLIPIAVFDTTSGFYGELEGVYFISGFNNVVENTCVIGGVTYVIIQDVYRTNFTDYIAIRMDT